jgi:uncharacterized protein YegL
MPSLKSISVARGRPLPVLLLADISGSMAAEGKIDALNQAVAAMLSSFAEEDADRIEIHSGVITFGQGGARLHLPMQPARTLRWDPLTASGGTPMGAAFDLATSVLSDREQVPGKAYRPALVLVSDGQPTDAWEEPLSRLLANERARKATRFAMAIGADADRAMLQRFLTGTEQRVFGAEDAKGIRKFFQWVTMSVTLPVRAANPEADEGYAPLPPEDYDL